MSFAGWLFVCVYDRLTAGLEAAGLGARRQWLRESARGSVRSSDAALVHQEF